MAVSAKRGIIGYAMTKKAFNATKFKFFIEKLRSVTEPSRCIYFIDNCRIHKTRIVQDACK
jgi:hypothetical protein